MNFISYFYPNDYKLIVPENLEVTKSQELLNPANCYEHISGRISVTNDNAISVFSNVNVDGRVYLCGEKGIYYWTDKFDLQLFAKF